jgi:hypothetical protein
LDDTIVRPLYGGPEAEYLGDNIFRVTRPLAQVEDYSVIEGVCEGYKCLCMDGSILVENKKLALSLPDCFDSLLMAFPSTLSYVENSLSPTAVFNDMLTNFEMDINLEGNTAIRIDAKSSRLELHYGDQFLAGFIADSALLKPGKNRITTGEIFIPGNLLGESLTPLLILSGMEEYVYRLDTVSFSGQTVLVSGQTGMDSHAKIISTDALLPNAPYVNHNQEFQIEVTVNNPSAYDADSVSLYLQSEDGSIIFDSIMNITLPPLGNFDTLFNLIAPDISSPSVIYKTVAVSPTTTILPPSDNIAVVTVQAPALIELSYILNNAEGGFVGYGTEFSVAAMMLNLGEASIGDGEISLITEPIDFGISDSSSFALGSGEIVEWNLIAPDVSLITTLRLRLTGIPDDLNTGQPSGVITDLINIPITVQPGTAELVVSGIALPLPLIVEGSTENVFDIQIYSNTESPLDIIGLNHIAVEIHDRFGHLISPDLVVEQTGSGFYYNGNEVTSVSNAGNRLLFTFDNFIFNPEDVHGLILKINFGNEIALDGFSINLDTRDISAAFVDGPRMYQTVPVMGKTVDVFRLSNEIAVIETGMERSLQIKNNPFNPEEGPAEIAYILDDDMDIDLIIYTLIGEKVYERSYRAGESGGEAGLNIIQWAGVNDEGHEVLNGVYIAIIDDHTGKTYKLKIAVVR